MHARALFRNKKREYLKGDVSEVLMGVGKVPSSNASCWTRSVSSDAIDDLSIIRACNETSPINLDVMNEALIHRSMSSKTTDVFKCFLHCLYTKYNWMDEAGNFLNTQMKETLQLSELDEFAINWIIFKCTALDSTEKCERSFRFTECFWTEAQKVCTCEISVNMF
ncbi:unnamed protein product [Timema podura]|uniref:Uncharacterized protein n=1 Tax=Timema podura TaxID=61482 RepID=A0ABN7NXQ5_TIMPD|nr:unnamed protein product [Timema podura]